MSSTPASSTKFPEKTPLGVFFFVSCNENQWCNSPGQYLLKLSSFGGQLHPLVSVYV